MTVGVSLNHTIAGNFSKQPDLIWAVPAGGSGWGGEGFPGGFPVATGWPQEALAALPRWPQSQHLPPSLLLLLVVPLAGQMSLLYLLSPGGREGQGPMQPAPTSGPRSAFSIHPWVCMPEEKNKEGGVE